MTLGKARLPEVFPWGGSDREKLVRALPCRSGSRAEM